MFGIPIRSIWRSLLWPACSMLSMFPRTEVTRSLPASTKHTRRFTDENKKALGSYTAESRSDLEAVSATRINQSSKVTSKVSNNFSAIHPMIRTHPETLLKSLYISPAHTCSIQGLDNEESRALLSELFIHQTKEEHQCRVKWNNGDVALWDNRCLLHLPLNDYQGQLRSLHRITLKGERPC